MTTPATPTVQPSVRERWVLLHGRLVRHTAALEAQLRALDRLPRDGGRSGPATLAHRASVAHRLYATEAALARMCDGTYGTCRYCQQVIPLDRLEDDPISVDCVPCARRQANDGWLP